MYARSRRYSDPKTGRWVTLAAIWTVILVILVGFGAAAFVMVTSPPDAFAVCQRNGVPMASTAVMVDTTDPLTDIQRRRVKTTIEAERDRLPRGGRLTVLSINPAAPWEPLEIVSACNPGTAAEANPLFVTRSKTDKRWAAGFAEPIDAAIDQANNGPASPSSPIVVTVAATLTRPDFDARVKQRRLVLISDLLEHQNGGYSQLKGGDFWKSFQASPLARTVALDLRGVPVAIDYLARPKYAAVQGAKHREFWRRLFTEALATEVTFIGLPQDNTAPSIDGVRMGKRTGSE